jgi:hypothetical protein
VVVRRLPQYDPKRDGHVFQWILRAAAQVREQVREQRRLQLGREYPVLVEARRKYLPRSEEF